MSEAEREEEKKLVGPIWGGWFLWEPPLGSLKETPEDTFLRLNPETASTVCRGNRQTQGDN